MAAACSAVRVNFMGLVLSEKRSRGLDGLHGGREMILICGVVSVAVSGMDAFRKRFIV